MLKLNNVTIKYNRQLILHNCNCDISPQSIIVSRNTVNTDIIAKSLSGFRPIDEGEIHLEESVLSKNEKSQSKMFFVITENYHKLWKNYRLQEIPRIISKTFQTSLLLKKYKISPQASIDSLTKFQQLIYFVSIGQSLNRTIFIFDQPTKYFDYEDLEQFYEFLRLDFLNANYVILTNRYDEIFTKLSKPIYHINSAKLLVLKGGETNVGQQKK